MDGSMYHMRIVSICIRSAPGSGSSYIRIDPRSGSYVRTDPEPGSKYIRADPGP